MARQIVIEDLMALDALHAACVHLKNGFRFDMTRDEAQANLDARALLFGISNRILDECGEGITRAEIEGVLILERQLAD